jgi:hypothetical protein
MRSEQRPQTNCEEKRSASKKETNFFMNKEIYDAAIFRRVHIELNAEAHLPKQQVDEKEWSDVLISSVWKTECAVSGRDRNGNSC